jgi:hypothetical protein
LHQTTHKVSSDFTNWQGVADDFLLEDEASSYKNMVLRVWFMSADVPGTTGVVAMAAEQNGYRALLPRDTSTMSSEIFLHDARGGESTTGTFNIVFVGSGGPEAMSVTVVYAQA